MRTAQFVIPTLYLSGFLLLLNLYSYGQMMQAMPKDTSFNAFLATLEQATSKFINGDPTLWKQLCSQSSDATILGGFGGYEKSWNEVSPRYDWASAQFKASGAKKQMEYISKIVNENLAYTVTVERANELWVNQEKPMPQALRVTQIYRKEAGEWKLLHRHADPFLEKEAPRY